MMSRKTTKAGAYADRQAKSGRADWQKRAAPRGRIFFWPAILIGLIGILALRPDVWGIVFGLLIGMGIMGYAAMLEAVPEQVLNWERGAEGERRTEDRLRELEAEGWTVVHDVQRGRSNWDHLVVGPPGVFVLDTKDRRGQLLVSDAIPELRIDNKTVNDQRIAEWPRYLTAAAVSVKKEIESAESERPWVQPVLVFWGDFPDRLVETSRLTFVHGDDLVSWLRGRPPKLSKGKQALIATVVQDLAERHATSAESDL